MTMTITTVLVGYTTLAATLALAISLLSLRSLQGSPAARPAVRTAVTLPASGPDVGSPAPPFTARTSTGAVLGPAELAGRNYLLAFVSSTCPGCREALPGMVGYASQLPGDFRLITVIVGDPRRGTDIEQTLAPVATIVSEPDGGPIGNAYQIHVFPSYVLISDDGTVLATGQSVRDLPQPQPQ
ncbi:TlpA family protein disulfide reductase [Jatrophihabitans sp.]|uniref:TlpA family protein disulfide reductase n=1 Tax=Jatrophihabitans sp. TaxID=1932789 RepID=UPI002F0C5639